MVENPEIAKAIKKYGIICGYSYLGPTKIEWICVGKPHRVEDRDGHRYVSRFV